MVRVERLAHARRVTIMETPLLDADRRERRVRKNGVRANSTANIIPRGLCAGNPYACWDSGFYKKKRPVFPPAVLD
jgi:hypothetical protein